MYYVYFTFLKNTWMCSYKNIGHKDQFSPPPAFTVAPRKGRPTFAAYYPAARSSKQKHSSWRLGSALREKQIAQKHVQDFT